MSDRVKFRLAHPLGTDDARELGLAERPYATNTELTLPRAYAERLASSGYVAGADPQNRETYATAMRPVVNADKPPIAETPETLAAAPASKPKPAKTGAGE
ncbi:hypothetical protein ACIHFD_49330 [Nonomuraea sp. NPDC051941]|uniref:hypothetical protein n=1 Tax=Nonomuraea sp. NPDC051941 TaxID=3364373 RepID=UPI0037C7AB18